MIRGASGSFCLIVIGCFPNKYSYLEHINSVYFLAKLLFPGHEFISWLNAPVYHEKPTPSSHFPQTLAGTSICSDIYGNIKRFWFVILMVAYEEIHIYGKNIKQ